MTIYISSKAFYFKKIVYVFIKKFIIYCPLKQWNRIMKSLVPILRSIVIVFHLAIHLRLKKRIKWRKIEQEAADGKKTYPIFAKDY